MRRLLPALVALALTLAVLAPTAMALSQFGDEQMYIWKGRYYAQRLLHLDFSPAGPHGYFDPGFYPPSFWTLEQTLGSNLVYGAVLVLLDLPGPAAPYNWGDPSLQGDSTRIPPESLPVVRLTAVLCAALGFGLLVWRFGWPGLAALALLLVPSYRENLARAWAEGPLLLGLALCVVAYGRRGFGPACGLAAALKLSALALWPLLLLPRSGRYARPFALLLAVAVWTLLTPTSWLAGGPLFLDDLLAYRLGTFGYQSANLQSSIFAGLYLPSRYTWPAMLAGLLGLARYLSHLRASASRA